VPTYAGKVMASFFWDIERILSVELLERSAIIHLFADFKVVQTMNLKGLTEQEDESNPPPA